MDIQDIKEGSVYYCNIKNVFIIPRTCAFTRYKLYNNYGVYIGYLSYPELSCFLSEMELTEIPREVYDIYTMIDYTPHRSYKYET
jgi:hypothetical protein